MGSPTSPCQLSSSSISFVSVVTVQAIGIDLKICTEQQPFLCGTFQSKWVVAGIEVVQDVNVCISGAQVNHQVAHTMYSPTWHALKLFRQSDLKYW